MDDKTSNKRQYVRYETEAKVFFKVSYNVNTIIKFKLLDKIKKKIVSKSYSAMSKNVSAQGLCFTSDKKLNVGDRLLIEVQLPGGNIGVMMEGEVRWSREDTEDPQRLNTGVKLITVNGQDVDSSIHNDPAYNVTWSVVLESVLGNYRIFAQNKNHLKIS